MPNNIIASTALDRAIVGFLAHQRALGRGYGNVEYITGLVTRGRYHDRQRLQDCPAKANSLILRIRHPHPPLGAAMPTPVHDLEAEVLSLPPEDRARLLERLIASFEPKSSAQRAWVDVALKRQAEVKSGKTSMVPGDEALARVRARLA